jgi:hypothetical protein
MAEKNPGLFKRLTRLFRSGPVVKHKIKARQSVNASTALDLFKKSQSAIYSNALNAYGQYDRMARYADFSEMEYTPEIASALDIYSHEIASQDDKGRVLHVTSDNSKLQDILEELFYDNLNIDFNITSWARNLCKYGDFFLFNDVSPDYGVVNAFPIPVNEIEREEGFDPEDPLAVRFRWVTQGNQPLENWQISHFRILGNDAFLPYGASILEAARRIWRQLILIEDAMLVYRVVRSPERRVFYIDVGNVSPEDIPAYMEQAKSALRSNQVIDKGTGRVDLRYNPLSVDEDYFLPVRGDQSGTKIDTLAGGTNVTAIEDVEYIQKKLFAALKIPRAYLGYDEMLSSKATLAQEDIRFSRTINSIQRVIISELNKLAIVHLFSHGYEGEDLLNFDIQLSNPSTIAQQQKLELYRTKFEIAAQAPEGMVSRDYIRRNILGLTKKEIFLIESEKENDKQRDLEIESVTLPAEGDEGEELGEETPEAAGEEPAADEEPPAGEGDEEAGLFASHTKYQPGLLEDDDIDTSDDDQEVPPISPVAQVRKKAKKRTGRNKRRDTHMPDFASMLSHDDVSLTDPYGQVRDDSINPLRGNPFNESGAAPSLLDAFYDGKIKEHGRMTQEIQSTLKTLERSIGIKRDTQPEVLVEENDKVGDNNE